MTPSFSGISRTGVCVGSLCMSTTGHWPHHSFLVDLAKCQYRFLSEGTRRADDDEGQMLRIEILDESDKLADELFTAHRTIRPDACSRSALFCSAKSCVPLSRPQLVKRTADLETSFQAQVCNNRQNPLCSVSRRCRGKISNGQHKLCTSSKEPSRPP